MCSHQKLEEKRNNTWGQVFQKGVFLEKEAFPKRVDHVFKPDIADVACCCFWLSLCCRCCCFSCCCFVVLLFCFCCGCRCCLFLPKRPCSMFSGFLPSVFVVCLLFCCFVVLLFRCFAFVGWATTTKERNIPPNNRNICFIVYLFVGFGVVLVFLCLFVFWFAWSLSKKGRSCV